VSGATCLPVIADDPGTVCLIAPLGADAARQPDQSVAPLTDGLRVRLDAWMKAGAGRSVAARREKALVTMATLVARSSSRAPSDDPACPTRFWSYGNELRRR